jgi:hypothetical protein
MTLLHRQPLVCRGLVLAAWWAITPLANAQNPAPSSARPQLELQCVSYGTGPMLECLVDLKRRDGAPLEGATVTLGGLMPSMPMAHTIRPVKAAATGRPGQYKATLEHINTRLEHQEGHYKEYFRYYMAQSLFQGDYDAWVKWNIATVRSLSESQGEDGGFGDAYQTGMSLLAVALNYRFLPIYER